MRWEEVVALSDWVTEPILLWFVVGLVLIIAATLTSETTKKIESYRHMKELQDLHGSILNEDMIHNLDALENVIDRMKKYDIYKQWHFASSIVQQGEYLSFRTISGDSHRGIFVGVYINPRNGNQYFCTLLEFHVEDIKNQGRVDKKPTRIDVLEIDQDSVFSRHDF